MIEAVYNETEIVINPHSDSNRGSIGIGRICPKNTVAVGFRLKIQRPEDTE
jgi:hypothetical protein